MSVYVQWLPLLFPTQSPLITSLNDLPLPSCNSILHIYAVKCVKCTLVQAQRLCTGRTAHRGSRGIALLFYDHSTRRGWGVSVTPRPLFTPGKDPIPIVQEARWAPRPVWTGAENLAPTGIRSPDRPYIWRDVSYILLSILQLHAILPTVGKSVKTHVYDSQCCTLGDVHLL